MRRIRLRHPVLQGNQIIADQNRQIFNQHSLLSLNVMSSPGAGKTTFLESTIQYLGNQMRIGVIEGDVATTLDAERIAACGAEVVQINTCSACHLDAGMISRVLGNFNLASIDFLIIENVGNLVCPAEFDLGESLCVTLLSTTEGADKAVKYPAVFQRSDAVILNKIDLLPYVNFDLKWFYDSMKELNPNAPIFQISALSGEGMAEWVHWLLTKRIEQRNESGRDSM